MVLCNGGRGQRRLVWDSVSVNVPVKDLSKSRTAAVCIVCTHAGSGQTFYLVPAYRALYVCMHVAVCSRY